MRSFRRSLTQLHQRFLGANRTGRLVGVFSLNLQAISYQQMGSQRGGRLGARGAYTYSSRGGLLVAGLAGDLEGNAVGGGVLELKGGGREVVEILVEELWERELCQRLQSLA